jgi:hypothetical protein
LGGIFRKAVGGRNLPRAPRRIYLALAQDQAFGQRAPGRGAEQQSCRCAHLH